MEKLRFIETAATCLANGQRLLDDADMLEYGDPPRSSFALAVIAQEEFAKGFLMFVASREVIPWNSLVYRATRDHTCKQLLGVVMSHMNPDDDEFFRRMNGWQASHQEVSRLLDAYKDALSAVERDKIWERIQEINTSQEFLPRSVADAINILRHEKIGRWQSSNWFWSEEPIYDDTAKRLAEGKQDRDKQDAFYVRLGRNGEVARTPAQVTREDTAQAIEIAKRFGSLIERLLSGNAGSIQDYEKIESAFKAVFASVSEVDKLSANES